MNLLNILPFIAAAIIILFNNQLLDYAEKKAIANNKSFDRQKAFLLSIGAVVILLLKGVL